MSRLSAVGLLVPLMMVDIASAQSIRCLVPFEASPTSADCILHQSPGATSTLILLEVRDAAGQPVARGRTVTAQSSSGSVPPTMTTLDQGLVKATLSGRVTADIEVTFRSGSAARKVVVKPALPTPVPLAVASGHDQYWFQGYELQDPVRVNLEGITSADQCEKTAVVFRPVSGGKLLADTVFGVMSRNDNRCQASTRWTLDNRVGYQGLRAATPGDKRGILIEARSRRLPRVFLGAHLGVQSGWNERISRPDTIVVTTPRDGGGQEVSKRIERNYSSKRRDVVASLDPVIGFDFPVWYEVEWLRLSLGAAIDNLKREWFLGASVLQPSKGFLQEALGMDIHLALNVVRQDEVVNPGSCLGNDCETDSKLGFGVGVMVVTDGAGVVTNLVKALGGG